MWDVGRICDGGKMKVDKSFAQLLVKDKMKLTDEEVKEIIITLRGMVSFFQELEEKIISKHFIDCVTEYAKLASARGVSAVELSKLLQV